MLKILSLALILNAVFGEKYFSLDPQSVHIPHTTEHRLVKYQPNDPNVIVGFSYE